MGTDEMCMHWLDAHCIIGVLRILNLKSKYFESK